ncbi:putative HC-toxin efflux carrier TOXA [Glarea lozoyensis 74030]|nr:putative HC-toxin efflux carrier TOXA [Glarea lozoyensis 74030]
MFAVSGSGFVVEFYSPLYYQAIHSTTPLGSALRDLPRLLALALSILLAGSVTTCIGFYTPTMLLGSILMSVGAGLITTWNTTTSLGQIIGYNLLYGAGVGFAFQQPFIAVQTVLPQKDVPAAIVVLQFAQYLGNIVALAVGESVFVEGLVEGLKGVEGVDEKLVLRVGALDLKRVVPEGVRGVVLGVYADALDRAFLVGCVLACGTVVGALGVKWRSVKGEKKVDGVERRVKKLEV